MNSRKVVILVTAVLVVVGGSIVLSKSLSKREKPSDQNQQDHLSHHAPQKADSTAFSALVGKEAPDFTLKTYDGQEIKLSDYKGKKVVLFFNEGLMCYPACWNQISAFGKDQAFNNNDTVTLNIVVDPKDQWKQAVDKMPELAQATVLLDENRQVSNLYSVLSLPSSMHKGQMPGHTYLIVDKEGIVTYVFDDPQMAVRNEDLKAQIEKL